MKKKNYDILIRNKVPINLIKENKQFKCSPVIYEDDIAVESLSSLKKEINSIKLENPRIDVTESIINSIELLLHFAKSIGMSNSEIKCKRDQITRANGTYDDNILLRWVEEE